MGFQALVSQMDLAAVTLIGEPLTYTPGVGSPVTVQGIFDAVYQLIPAGNAGVMSAGPAVYLRLMDLPSDPETDTAATVTIESVRYQFREVRKDGKGGVLLALHETT